MDSDSDVALPSPRSDLVTGGVWLVVGAALAIGSWRMDRLESQGVPWFTAPGLLPGIVGVMIVLTALLIVVRALRRRATSGATALDGGTGDERRALVSLALCMAFAAGLVGHGVPFWLAASLYLTTHIFVLQYPDRQAAGQVTRGALVAAVIGFGAAIAISLVFQELFLVRLP
jgi:Tripartite tricarboxylate transporter TctB family